MGLDTQSKVVIGAASAALYIIALGSTIDSCHQKQTIRNLLAEAEITHEQIEVVRNKNKSLVQVLKEADAKNTDLLEVIASLENQAPEVRYIVETKTVIQPSEPKLVVVDLPEEHLFQVGDKITVARFAEDTPEEYTFETYELTFKADLAIAENKTAVLFELQTSYEPDVWHEVPVELNVTEVREDTRKLFEPHIGMGITGSVPSLDISASLYSTLFHPSENLDLVGFRLSVSNDSLRFGVDPIGYNLGSELPVFTDLWVYGGASVDTQSNINADLTIGSKF